MGSKSLSRSVVLEILGDNKDVKKKLEETAKQGDDFSKRTYTATAGIDNKDGKKNLAEISGDVDTFGKKSASATAGVDTKDGQSTLGKLFSSLDTFGKKNVKASAGVDTTDGDADLDDLTARIKKFGDSSVSATAGVSDDDAKRKLIDLNESLTKLADSTFKPSAGLNDKDAQSKLLDLKVKLDKLGEEVVNPDIGVDGVAKASLEMDRLKLKMDALSHDTVDIKVKESGGRSGILEIFGGLLGGGAGGGGREFMRQLSFAGGEGGDSFMHSFIKASAFGMKGGIVTLGGMLVGALPALGAVTGGLIGVAMIGAIAAVLLSQNSKVKSAFSSMGKQVMGVLEQTIKPMVPYVLDIVHQIVPLIKQIAPVLTGIFRTVGPQLQGIFDNVKVIVLQLVDVMKAAAPAFGPMINALLDLVKAILPPLAAGIRSLIPSIKMFGGILSTIGKDLGSLFDQAGPAIKASMIVLGALLRIIGSLLPILMRLGDIFATALAPILGRVSNLFIQLLPTITAFGKILGGLAAAVLGSFIGILEAVVRLLVLCEPSLKILINTFGLLFRTLENTGVMFVLEDAIEKIVPALAQLVNVLVKNLAPILPVIIRLFGDFLGVLASGVGTILTGLIKGFTALISAIPPPVLRGIAYAVIAIAGAMKVWSLASGLATGAMKLLGIATEDTEGKVIAMTLAEKLQAIWDAIVTGAEVAWTAVTSALDAVLDANPIVIIILAILALIAVVVEAARHFKTWGQWVLIGLSPVLGPLGVMIILAVEIIRHWKAVKDFFKDLWHDMKNWSIDAWKGIKVGADWAWAALKPIAETLARFFVAAWGTIKTVGVAIWHALGSAWNWLYGVLKAGFNGVRAFYTAEWDIIKTIGVAVWHGLAAAWDWLYGVLKAGFNGAKSLFSTVWADIKTIAVNVWHAVAAAWDWLYGVLKSGVDLLRSLWSTVWTFMKNLAVDVWHGIVAAWNWMYGVLKSGIDLLRNFFTSAWTDIKNFIVGVWHDIVSVWNWAVSVMRSAISDLKNFFSTVWNFIKDFIEGIWHDIVDAWGAAVNSIKDGINDVENWFKHVWNNIWNFFSGIRDDIVHGWDTLVSDIVGGMNSAYKWVTHVLGNVQNAFHSAISFVEGKILAPLFRVWNDIAGAIGLKPLELHYFGAADGGLVPKMADGGPVAFAGGGRVGGNGITDSTHAILKPGEYVMNRRQLANAGGPANLEKNYGYSSSSGRARMADGGSPLSGSPSGSDPLSGKPSPGNSHPLGTAPDPLGPPGSTYQSGGGNGSSIFSDIWGGIKDVGKWAGTLITKYALDPAIKHVLGPILTMMGSGLGAYGDLGKILETMVNNVVVKLMADAEGTGGGGGSASSIIAFAKSFVGKVPYHLGGGADYAPYGEIKNPGDANRLGGWDCAGFVGQMYGHFGIGPGPAGINVSKLEGWGKKTAHPVIGGFATEAGDQTVSDPGHVVLIATPTTSIQAAHTGTDTIEVADHNAWVTTYVPPHGFGAAAAADAKAGGTQQDGKAIYQYLGANLFNGNRIAAAGAIASIYGESTWNPDSENCVPLTYKVVTTRGILAHDEVKPGDYTRVFDPITRKIVESEILDVPYHPGARLCRIGNAHWSVTCTWDHKWIVKDGGLLYAAWIFEGTEIMIGENRYETIDFFEDMGEAENTFCLTTTTGTWTAYRDEEIAAQEGVEPGEFWTGNTGGRGLIGWTPASKLPNSAFTGNKTHDLDAQLPLIITYVHGVPGWQSTISRMEKAKTVADAANLWGPDIEHFGLNDVHATGIALATDIMRGTPITGGGGAGRTYTPAQLAAEVKKLGGENLFGGGIITEPIFGQGLYSGRPYSLGEFGNEAVIPLNGNNASAGGGGDIYNIYPPESATNPDAYALTVIQALRQYKRHHGNQATGVG